MGSSQRKSASPSEPIGQPVVVGQVPPLQQMPGQQGQTQLRVHPVLLAAQQQPVSQSNNVQQPIQQRQGFVSSQQPPTVSIVSQQPTVTPFIPQQPIVAPQQPVMITGVPQAQPVYMQQPVQVGQGQ